MRKAQKGARQVVSGCLGGLGLLVILSCGGLLLIVLKAPDVGEQGRGAPKPRSVVQKPARSQTDAPIAAEQKLEQQIEQGPPLIAEAAMNDGIPPADDDGASGTTLPPAKATVVFKSGKRQVLRDYEEDGDSYRLYGLLGGTVRYPKSLIERFEPTTEADFAMIRKRVERHMEQADRIRRRKEHKARQEQAAKAGSRPSEFNAIINEEAMVAATEESYNALVRASVAKDKYGLGELLLSGDVFVVQAGTRALMLEHGYVKRKIRVLEGDNAFRSGWISAEYVRDVRTEQKTSVGDQ